MKSSYQEEQEPEEKPQSDKGAVAYTAVTTAVAGTVLGTKSLVATALGFGSAGVQAGSAAAWFQSAFYGGAVTSGSLFAGLQAAGATATMGGLIATGGGLIAAPFIGYYGYKYITKHMIRSKY